MKFMNILRKLALAATLFSAGVAQAAVLQFTLTGDYSAQWQLNSTATPDASTAGQTFTFWDVDGFPDALLGVADLTFYHGDQGGGFQIDDFYGEFTLLITDGPQLYDGLESAPIFKLGTFALTEFLGSGVYTLTIAEVDAVDVPEPASVLLLIGGLALIGAQRKRRNSR